jgi:hypothetical protein
MDGTGGLHVKQGGFVLILQVPYISPRYLLILYHMSICMCVYICDHICFYIHIYLIGLASTYERKHVTFHFFFGRTGV